MRLGDSPLIPTLFLQTSLKFYTDLFDLPVLLNRDGNIMLMGGLVLQDEKIWKQYIPPPSTMGKMQPHSTSRPPTWTPS